MRSAVNDPNEYTGPGTGYRLGSATGRGVLVAALVILIWVFFTLIVFGPLIPLGSQLIGDRLGGTAWKKQREKTREAIQQMAAELLDLYAKRLARQGFAF